MATPLPPVSAALRTRLEGAVEDVEFLLQARDGGRLRELAERWKRSCEAVEAVRRHEELLPLAQAFDAERSELEVWTRRECEALGLRVVPTVPERLQAIAVARAQGELGTHVETGETRWSLVCGAAFVVVVAATWLALGPELISMVLTLGEMLLFAGLWAALRATFSWELTTTHVLLKWPRRASLALRDVTHLVSMHGALAVQTASQRLTLRTSHPDDVALLISLLKRRVPLADGSVEFQTSAKGYSVILDASGLAAVSAGPAWVLRRFAPRPLAEALSGDFFAHERLRITLKPQTVSFAFGDDEVTFREGVDSWGAVHREPHELAQKWLDARAARESGET